MRTWTLRFGLSLMVMLSFWTSRLPAQEILIVPEVPYEPAHHAPAPWALAPRPLPAPADHWARRVLNQHGVGCANDPFYPACINWRYQATFVFGSCRSFFDQQCEAGKFCGDKHRQR